MKQDFIQYQTHSYQQLEGHATFKQVQNDRVEPLTMLMYKNQPR